jgi:hypothetical protein
VAVLPAELDGGGLKTTQNVAHWAAKKEGGGLSFSVLAKSPTATAGADAAVTTTKKGW